jgi:adenylylsulfate kinase
MKILIMGLPGAGKTWLAERLTKHVDNCAWYNADVIRGAANDWDFTGEGRIRQAQRMKTFADFETMHGRNVICDFVAPVKQAREDFAADIVIWIDTITEGRFEDTNKIFEQPENADFHVTEHLSDGDIAALAKEIIDAR